MLDDHRDSIASCLGASAGNLCWNGRNMEIEGTQDIHGKIKKVYREAIRGVHVQIKCAVEVKLSATGREDKATRAVGRETTPI